VIEEHGKYLFKNQLPEEQPYFQENLRMSFVLVVVTNVGQYFIVFPRGSYYRELVLTSGLLTNRLIQQKSYRRTKKINIGELLKYHPMDKSRYMIQNSWTSFSKVEEPDVGKLEAKMTIISRGQEARVSKG
jgi:hypothetical protein